MPDLRYAPHRTFDTITPDLRNAYLQISGITSYLPTRQTIYISPDLRYIFHQIFAITSPVTPRIPPDHGYTSLRIFATTLPVQRYPFHHTMALHSTRSRSLQSCQFNAIHSTTPWLYISSDLHYNPTSSTPSIPTHHGYTSLQIFATILPNLRHPFHLTMSIHVTRSSLKSC